MTGSSAGAFVRARHAGIGRAFGSTTMAVYVIVLMTIFLTPLLVNIMVVVLTRPLIATALTAPQASNWTIFILGFATLLAIVVGGIRGPIAPGRFEATLRLQSPQPRWRALGSTALRALLSTTLVLGLAGLIVGIGGSIALNWSMSTVLVSGLAGLGLGLAVATGGLLGQTKVPVLTTGFAVALSATSVLSINYDVFSTAVIVELGLLAFSTPWLAPFCLGRMRTETVLKHSALAEASSALTRTGDWSAASREYRLAPSRGRSSRVLPRRMSAIIPRTPWGLWLSAWRAPQRAYLGIFLIALGALLFGGGISLRDPAGGSPVDFGVLVIVLAAALSLIYWGFGSFSEGLEFAAETAGSVSVFRLSPGVLLARTGASYILLMLMIGLPLTVLLGYLTIGDLTVLRPTLGAATVLGLIQIATARIHSATKGPLPLQLTTPIPTPAGDISVLMILAWQVQAVVCGPVAAAVLVIGSVTTPWWMVGSVVLILLMVRSMQKRLRV
ncbi:MAG: hypothetical protein L0K67_08455 [Brevibacterium sp.]|nr:hypothetical protein [Brevibacterium sp.]